MIAFRLMIFNGIINYVLFKEMQVKNKNKQSWKKPIQLLSRD